MLAVDADDLAGFTIHQVDLLSMMLVPKCGSHHSKRKTDLRPLGLFLHGAQVRSSLGKTLEGVLHFAAATITVVHISTFTLIYTPLRPTARVIGPSASAGKLLTA